MVNCYLVRWFDWCCVQRLINKNPALRRDEVCLCGFCREVDGENCNSHCFPLRVLYCFQVPILNYLQSLLDLFAKIF